MRAPTPSATDRLSRLLALVPWLLEHQGVPLADAARHFALTEAELVRDLELLFVCGTPGHLPGDLIEAEWEGGRVYLGNAGAISRPLRLSMDEALALLAGLRTLAEVPGALDDDRTALTGALAKLSEAAGESVALARAVRVDLSDGLDAARGRGGPALATGSVAAVGDTAAALTAARTALAGHRRLHLRYLVPSRDESTERDVDPMRVIVVDGHWYLEAWCHRADGVRLFRLDRVLEARVLDVDGTPPPGAVGRDLDEAMFRPSPGDLVVTLDLDAGAAWVAEHYPVDEVQPLPDGRQRVLLRTADPRWVARLVLSLGGSAVVAGPPALVTAVREAAQRALAGYSRPPSTLGVTGEQRPRVTVVTTGVKERRPPADTGGEAPEARGRGVEEVLCSDHDQGFVPHLR